MSDLTAALVPTLGTLVGSFGGFLLAARAQRHQSEQADARAIRDAHRARLLALEDERHAFQLETLLALQELIRKHVRYTLLTIEQDRSTIRNGQGYRLLPDSDADDFENAIALSHAIARVTAEDLRMRLETLSAMCARYSLPPLGAESLDKDAALAVQNERAGSLLSEAEGVSEMLGQHLRREIDRRATAARGE